jgi:hypothetical protein
MPRATVNINDTIRKDLKTAPPDGYVELRRYSYGEKLDRREMVSKMTMKDDGLQGRKSKSTGSMEMQLITAAATQYDFAHCVVDHNLQDETGRKLNLASPQDIRRLDPRIGEEIDTLIGELNNFEEDEDDFRPAGEDERHPEQDSIKLGSNSDRVDGPVQGASLPA